MGNHVIRYLTIAFIGISISLLLFVRINNGKVQKNKLIVKNAIDEAELKIGNELQKIDLVIESMSFFFEKTNDISQKEFERLTNPFKDDLKGMKALTWAPSISEPEKEVLVANDIKELLLPIMETDSSNTLIKSADKKLYYPIALINPFQKLQEIIGYDLYSDDTRKMAIAQSTSCKQMAFTGPIDLVSEQNETLGFLAIKSVFEPDGIEVKGVVVVAYRMDKFLLNSLGDEIEILDVIVKDEYADNAVLYNSFSNLGLPKSSKAQKKLRLPAAGRIWNINFYPKKRYFAYPHTMESYLVLSMGLLATLFFMAKYKRRLGRRKELERKVLQRTRALQVSNENLETSNQQKENLLREIHHRVMNNLQITSSLMNLQKRQLQDEKAIMALSSSQDRINAIALIHKKIYQHDGADAVELKEYLENLVKSHKLISPNARYKIDCPKVFLDLDTAVPLAIITFEIVTNALKHAFSKESAENLLHIIVTPMKEDVIDIVISDNGVGLPKLKESTNSGLGHEIIKKLCRQLNAEYEYSSSVYGTVFRLRFKRRKLKMPVFA